jgi:small ligand-binding sensory domain FIST
VLQLRVTIGFRVAPAARSVLVKWASGASESSDVEGAVREAAEAVREELGDLAPDLAFLFASERYRSDEESLVELAGEVLGVDQLVGCGAQGVIGGGRELEEPAGLALTAAVLPDVSTHTFRLPSETLPDPDPEVWRELLGIEAEPTPHFILLGDPSTFDTEALLQSLDAQFPSSVKVGGLASGGTQAGAHSLYLGGQVYRSGLVGVALQGDIEIDPLVAQGCRPIANPLFVTRCRGNLVLELDNRRPVELLEELFQQASPRDRALLRTSLFLGIEMRSAQHVYRQGDFLIRNLIGVDPESGSLAVGANLEAGQVVQFHLRDARTSAEDLDHHLARYAGRRDTRCLAEGALLFSCLGRGVNLYGEPDHDTRLFREHLGEIPLGGFFCNGEIGPVQGQTFLHGYTSVFALFRRRTRLDA